MPSPYETAARILDALAKNNPTTKEGFPSVSSSHLKSIVYTNSRSTTNASSGSHDSNSKKGTGKSAAKNSSGNNNDLRQIYAIVASTLRYAPILKAVIRGSDLFSAKRPERRYFVNEWHAMAMIHDLLISKSKRITAPKCKSKDAILNNKTRLNGEFIKWKVRHKVRTAEDLEKLTLPLTDAGSQKGGDQNNGENGEDDTPVRWVRLNAIKCTSAEDLKLREEVLTKEGDIPFVPDWKDIKTFGQGKEGDDRLAIYKDTIVENLYGVSPSSALFPITSTKLYATGRLIIQDRASCFPATILIENLRKLGVDISDLKNDIQGAGEKAKGPKKNGKNKTAQQDNSHIKLIDACAAPGNKTTHLTGLALTYYPKLIESSDTSSPAHQISKSKKNGANKHVVSASKFLAAFERSDFRAKTLSKMLQVAGAAKHVDINVQDFTASDPSLYPNVAGLVVDPSCSGSGIFGRTGSKDAEAEETPEQVQLSNDSGDDQDQNMDDEEKEKLIKEKEREQQQKQTERLLKLAGFQYKVVKHALSFPNAQAVVYSTCSIHAIENEHVVARLLNDEQVKRWGWRVQSRDTVLPKWERRGIPEELNLLEKKGKGDGEIKRVAEGCIRALPKEDGGIGFFAVCFVRDAIPQSGVNDESKKIEGEDEEEWGGFSD